MDRRSDVPENENYVDPGQNNPPEDQADLQGQGNEQMEEEVDDDDDDMPDLPGAAGQHIPHGINQQPLNIINLNDFQNEPAAAPIPQNLYQNVLIKNGEHHESQKIHSQIPIYIVEDHHHVVPFIHENIRRRFLPVKGNTLIHLDSHPDMLVPSKMPADHAYDTRRLYEAHDIENWIMPNCYTGILQHLIWVKPPWCNQIRNIHQKLYIGKCKESSTIRLESRENYFISEGIFKFREQMDAVQEITLDCLSLGNRLIEAGDDIGHMKHLSENNDKTPTILDIDLDFFSTRNPFLDLYENANLYARLKNLFNFVPPISYSDAHIQVAQEARIAQLDELEKLFTHLHEFKSMPEFEGPQPSPLYTGVAAIVAALSDTYEIDTIEWLTVFAAGCTIDDHELPHHVSTSDELNIMFQGFENFLDTFLETPRIITISRSSRDEYTPADQVDYIQERVVEILNRKFVCASPVLYYLEMAVDDEEPDAVNEEQEEMEPVSVSSDSSVSALSQMSEELLKSDSGAGPSGVPVAPKKESSPDTSDEADQICDFEASGPSTI